MKSKNTPWWYKYRRQIYKKRNYLTPEMIIRRSFAETLKEYLATTSLGGVKQICDPANTRFRRLVWIAIFCTAFTWVCLFLRATWMTTFTSPLIVTGESTTYPISEIDFPAVSLCNFNRISKKASLAYSEDTFRKKIYGNSSLYHISQFFENIGRLIDYRYEDSVRRTINRMSKEVNWNMVKLMRELAPNCNEMLLKCKWAGQDVNCTNIFRIRRTGLGHCCSFNYVLQSNAADEPTPNGLIAPVKRQELPGANNGLIVVADPMVDDYVYRLGARDGFQVLIHDARQFPDLSGGRILNRMAQPNFAQFLQIDSVKQYATAEVHKYTHETRQCLFHNELKNIFGNMYSLSACLVRCRIETVRSLCKCIPFFYPNRDYKYYEICTLKHLSCLSKYKEKLMYLYPIDAKNTSGLEAELADSLYCPDCLPNCELTQHFTRSYKVSLAKLSRKGFESNFLVDVNVTNKCVLNIFHSSAFGVLHRLDVVSYWFEILSNIGGFAGMMMGIGFFTFVEILYYITIRFIRSIYINHKKYHNL